MTKPSPLSARIETLERNYSNLRTQIDHLHADLLDRLNVVRKVIISIIMVLLGVQGGMIIYLLQIVQE